MKGWRATGDWARVPEDRVTVSKSVFSTGLAGEAPCVRASTPLQDQGGIHVSSQRSQSLPFLQEALPALSVMGRSRAILVGWVGGPACPLESHSDTCGSQEEEPCPQLADVT